MTSSDVTALPDGAEEVLAARVGSVLRGDRYGSRVRVGLACAAFNGGITVRLADGAVSGLGECGVDPADIRLAWVPGAFELPLVAHALTRASDAVICLGAVIRGDTGHYDFVAGECAAGIQRVQLDTGVPVVFGVLTTDTVRQALDRSAPGPANKGREAAMTAVEMHRLLRSAMI